MIISIKPANGLKIRNPKDGQPLPADRTTRVEINQYWTRRLNAGDVVEEKDKPKKVLKSRKKKQAEQPEELGDDNGY